MVKNNEQRSLFAMRLSVLPGKRKALQEYADFVRETRANDDSTIVNPLRFLERAAADAGDAHCCLKPNVFIRKPSQ